MNFSKCIWLWQLQDLNLQFSGQGQCSCQMDSCQVRPRSLDSGPLVKGYKWTSLLPLSCDLINEFFKLCNTYRHLPYLKHCIKYFKCLINSQSSFRERAIGQVVVVRLSHPLAYYSVRILENKWTVIKKKWQLPLFDDFEIQMELPFFLRSWEEERIKLYKLLLSRKSFSEHSLII